jgi:hypothetical protein
VHHIRADPPAGPHDELLDLVQVLVDRSHPMLTGHRRLPGRPQRHIPGHGVVVTPRQLAGGAVTAREIERLQDLHNLLVSLHRQTIPTGLLLSITGEISGRQRGEHRPSPGQ